MAERPILFSAPMVRALLAGTKTQTRRAVKPQPERDRGGVLMWRSGKYSGFGVEGVDVPQMLLERSPYGKRGDRLWVRETWAVSHAVDHLKPREVPQGSGMVYYAATENTGGLLKRPSIFMPRWASRITLEVTGVRVEKLQDITHGDVEAEGIPCPGAPRPTLMQKAEHCSMYRALWESINGRSSWDTNPWVWAIEFKMFEP